MPSPSSTLRAWVADHRPRSARDGYPDHIRDEVLRHVRPLRDAGRSLASLAREVGLSAPTLGRWLEFGEARGMSGFIEVEVRREHEVGDDAGRRGSLTLLTPAGYRVEGLDVDALRELLRVLP